MPASEPASAHWRTSSHSNETGACVEVASTPGVTGVRDSKQGGRGPVLAFERAAWVGFLGKVKRGDFDLRT